RESQRAPSATTLVGAAGANTTSTVRALAKRTVTDAGAETPASGSSSLVETSRATPPSTSLSESTERRSKRPPERSKKRPPVAVWLASTAPSRSETEMRNGACAISTVASRPTMRVRSPRCSTRTSAPPGAARSLHPARANTSDEATSAYATAASGRKPPNQDVADDIAARDIKGPRRPPDAGSSAREREQRIERLRFRPIPARDEVERPLPDRDERELRRAEEGAAEAAPEEAPAVDRRDRDAGDAGADRRREVRRPEHRPHRRQAVGEEHEERVALAGARRDRGRERRRLAEARRQVAVALGERGEPERPVRRHVLFRDHPQLRAHRRARHDRDERQALAGREPAAERHHRFAAQR